MKLIKVWTITAITVLMVNFLFAQTAEDAIRITDNQTGFGARALGMAGAYTAVADDYSAIYWNPAGLAQMRKMEFWMGFSHNKFENNIIYRNSASNVSNNATKFRSLGIVFPIPTYRGSLVFSLGYQKIKDFEYANSFSGTSPEGTDRLSFELDTTGVIYDFWRKDVEKQELVTDEGNLNQWSFAGAIDISPNISLGIGLNFWRGSSNYQLDFKQFDTFDNFRIFPANFTDYFEDRTIISKYSSFSAKLSALMRAGRNARIGLTLELPQTININEDYRSSSSVSFDDGEIIEFPDEEGEFEYDVKIPFRFSGGISLAAGPIMISGSALYTDWTQVKFDLPSNAPLDADYADLLDENMRFRQEYRETLKWSLGGEIGLPFFDSQFRAGIAYDPSPRKNAPSDNDRKYYSLGYGILIDRILKLDIAFLQGNWKQTTFDDLAPSGTYEDIKVRKIIFTISYRF